MKKRITFKKGVTITGIFDKLKDQGDMITVSNYTSENGYRAEARRRNALAREMGQIGKKDVKFSVSVSKMEGTISIRYNKED